jgi:hypothetical protein
MLDLVNPALARRRLRDEGREFGPDEPGPGTGCAEHIRANVVGVSGAGKLSELLKRRATQLEVVDPNLCLTTENAMRGRENDHTT